MTRTAIRDVFELKRYSQVPANVAFHMGQVSCAVKGIILGSPVVGIENVNKIPIFCQEIKQTLKRNTGTFYTIHIFYCHIFFICKPYK